MLGFKSYVTVVDGNGMVVQQRMYQLIRQQGPTRERQFEIDFLDALAEAFCFTSG